MSKEETESAEENIDTEEQRATYLDSHLNETDESIKALVNATDYLRNIVRSVAEKDNEIDGLKAEIKVMQQRIDQMQLEFDAPFA